MKSVCSIDTCDQPAKTRGWCQKHYMRWVRHGDTSDTLEATTNSSICSVDGCEERVIARLWCRKHYTRWWKHGDPGTVLVSGEDICVIPGCEAPVKARGWCQKHYRRSQRHGDPIIGTRRRRIGNPIERWWSMVTTDPVGCWLWDADHLDQNGYGVFRSGIKGEPVQAHRWGYVKFVGPIPDGYHIDHVLSRGCTHRNCVRFDHLEAVTPAENAHRGQGWSGINARKTHCPKGHVLQPSVNGKARVCIECHVPKGNYPWQKFKTHCKRGHEFTEENTRVRAKTGKRNCRTCDRTYNHIWRAGQRANSAT